MHDDGDIPNRLPDRGGRLVLFGVVAILVGIGCGLLGLLQAAVPLLARAMPALDRTADAATAFAGAFVYLALGAAFVGLGWGSLNKRRWVRPLMLTMAWTWLLGGLVALAMLPWLVPAALAGADPGLATPGAVRIVTIGLAVAVGLAGIALPTLFVLVYRDPALQATCERHDPTPAWTERCPTRVLGMAVALAACGVILVPFAARPAVPLFGLLVDGLPGALLTLATAAACIWSAVSLFRLRTSGWWAVTLFLAGLGLSTAITFAVVGPAELYHALGIPPDLQPAGGAEPPTGLRVGLVASAVALTLATLVYMVRIRPDLDAPA